MSETEASRLPNGWIWTTIGELVYLNPSWWNKELEDNDYVTFVPMAAVEAESGRINASARKLWKEAKKGFTRFQERDVLFAKITPSMENGKFAVATNLPSGISVGSTEFHVLRPVADIEPKFLLFFLLQKKFRQAARISMKGAAGQLRVPPEFLSQTKLPLPSSAEQRRIIAEIEKHFTRLDAAVIELKRVQAKLKHYRAGILQAACEGRLVPTEAKLAQAEGREYESADQLLKRILKARREKWEADQLSKMEAAGKPPQDDKWKDKYVEPVAAETSQLPELPEGWKWVTVEQLVTKVQYGTSARTNEDSNGIPVLRMGNIQDGKLVFDQLKYLPRGHEEFPALFLELGDVLFNRTNSAELVGKTALYSGSSKPFLFASYLIRVRLANDYVPSLFVYFLNSN